MSFVIFDTEYTSWKGCQEHGWTGTQKREIVQIAALKVSDDFEVEGTFNQLCQPAINPVLSDYFVELTKITNAQIKQYGLPFAEAYEKFAVFAANDVCFSHGWGGDYKNESDGAIIAENLQLYGLKNKHHLVFRNVAAVFKELYAKHNIAVRSQSSGEIVHILNIENRLERLGINPHNALYDVYSILEGLKYFKEDIAALTADGFIIK